MDNNCDKEASTVSESELEGIDSKADGPSHKKIGAEYKKTYCTYCESFVISRHFSRHLQQRHKNNSMVKLLLDVKGIYVYVLKSKLHVHSSRFV